MTPADRVVRDAEGRLVLGDPSATCQHCGAAAVMVVSESGTAVVWHLPVACCPARFARTPMEPAPIFADTPPPVASVEDAPENVIRTGVRDWWND